MNPKVAVDATGSCGYDTLDILIKEHKCNMSSHYIKDYESINHTFKMRTVLKEAVSMNSDEEMKEIKELFHATQSSHLNTTEKDERWLSIADGNNWLDTFGLRVLARKLGHDIIIFSDKMITITHSGSNIQRRPFLMSQTKDHFMPLIEGTPWLWFHYCSDGSVKLPWCDHLKTRDKQLKCNILEPLKFGSNIKEWIKEQTHKYNMDTNIKPYHKDPTRCDRPRCQVNQEPERNDWSYVRKKNQKRVKDFTDMKINSKNIFDVLSKDQDTEDHSSDNSIETSKQIKNYTEQNSTINESIDLPNWTEVTRHSTRRRTFRRMQTTELTNKFLTNRPTRKSNYYYTITHTGVPTPNNKIHILKQTFTPLTKKNKRIKNQKINTTTNHDNQQKNGIERKIYEISNNIIPSTPKGCTMKATNQAILTVNKREVEKIQRLPNSTMEITNTDVKGNLSITTSDQQTQHTSLNNEKDLQPMNNIQRKNLQQTENRPGYLLNTEPPKETDTIDNFQINPLPRTKEKLLYNQQEISNTTNETNTTLVLVSEDSSNTTNDPCKSDYSHHVNHNNTRQNHDTDGSTKKKQEKESPKDTFLVTDEIEEEKGVIAMDGLNRIQEINPGKVENKKNIEIIKEAKRIKTINELSGIQEANTEGAEEENETELEVKERGKPKNIKEVKIINDFNISDSGTIYPIDINTIKRQEKNSPGGTSSITNEIKGEKEIKKMDELNKIQEFYPEKTRENKGIKIEENKDRRMKIPKINKIQEVCSKKNNDNKSEAIYSLDDHKIQVSETDKKKKIDKFVKIFDNVQVKNDHSNLTTVIKIPTYLILCLLHILVKMILYFSIPKRYQTKSKQTNQTVRTSLRMNPTLIMNTNNQPEEKSIIATIRCKGVNDTQEDGIEDITTQSNENKLIKVEINTQEEEIKLITGTKLLTRALNPDLCVTTRCNKCKGCKTCSPLIDISTKALENMKKNEENKIIRSFLTIREYPNGQNDFMITLPATKDVKMETFKYSNKKGVIASNDRKLLKLTEEQRKDLWTEFTKMVNLGYIREVKKASDFLKQQLKSSNFLYYIACAPAFKSSSMSTSTRCAWAALLLNTILPTGFMKLDMTKTFRRFRMLPCAYAVDVRKYYNSIHLDPEDYTINRIIFRDNASNIGETREYYLSRLFYGIKPAGAITDECLKYIAIEANRECEDCIEDEVTDDETNVEENSILNSIRRIKMSQNKEEKNNTNIGNDNHHDFSYIDETDLNTDQQCNKDITYETTDEGTVKEDTIAYKIPLGKQDHNTGEETTNIKEGKETNKIKTKREDCKNIVHKFYKTIMRKYVDDILGSEWNEATIEELEAYTERKLSRYSFTTKGWTKNYKRVPEDDDHLNEYDEMGTCSYQWKPYPNDTIAPKKVILHNGRKFRGAIIQITDFYDEDEQGNKIRIKAPELKMKVFRNADEVSTKALQELFANTPRTLRSCLSKVMMLFEPCGLLSPLTIQTRAALSEIVKVTSNNFDQIVPKRLYQHLLKCLAESIKGMCWEFKRRPDGDKLKTRPKFKLLTFWDYAKAVNIASYIVTKTDENKQSCFLINGKAMLLKQTTPKGELTAFAMASTIHKELRDEFADLIDEDYIIGDSEISIYQALRSINANVYVNNRVKTIQENINVLEKTYHVTGENNLADLGTRYGTLEDNSKGNLFCVTLLNSKKIC